MLTIEELQEHYKNVRARIENAAKKKPIEKVIAPPPDDEDNWKNAFDAAKEKYGVIATPYMDIVNAVSKESGIPRDVIFSKTRKQPVVMARCIIFDRIRSELGWSLVKIAKLFQMDHTTVLHGIRLARGCTGKNEGEKT